MPESEELKYIENKTTKRPSLNVKLNALTKQTRSVLTNMRSNAVKQLFFPSTFERRICSAMSVKHYLIINITMYFTCTIKDKKKLFCV